MIPAVTGGLAHASHGDIEVLLAHLLLRELERLWIGRNVEILHLTLQLLKLVWQLLLLRYHAHVDILLVGGGDLLLLLLQHLYLLGES